MTSREQHNNSPTHPATIHLVTLILFVTITSQLIGLAFGRVNHEQNFTNILLPSIFFLSAITIPLAWSGISLGRKVGLGVPKIEALLSRQPGSLSKIRSSLFHPVGIGLMLGAALLLIRRFSLPYLPPEIPAFGHRGVIGGLAVSIGAAVAEEVWFRLGLMTILVWLVAKVTGSAHVRPVSIWLIIMITSIGFGAAHLPQLLSYGAGSPFAIGGTILGNTLVGILYGWSYWRNGLPAAIAAHFTVDVVLHVFSAI